MIYETDERKQPQLFRHYLQNELVKRCQNNGSYSLRAFARSLNIASSSLSAIINGKRPITNKMKTRLGLELGLSPEQIENLQSCQDQTQLQEQTTKQQVQQITLDQYAIISDWYHYAILELIKVKNFEPNSQWIAKCLGLSKSVINIAIERLQRVGLLEITEEGKFVDTSCDFLLTNINDKFTSAGAKKLQRQLLEKSKQTLDEIPLEKRNHTSMTMAININDLEKAKEKITKFRREMLEFFEQSDCSDEVYNLSISLFPLSNYKGDS